MLSAFRTATLAGVSAAVLVSAGCALNPPRSPVGQTESPRAAQDVPAHVQFLRALHQAVRPEATSYRHSKAQVQLSEGGTSFCHADCSSLLNKVFEQTLGVDEPSIGAWLGRDRPRAREYFDAISSQRGFQLINQIADVKVGDVIAIRYESGASNTGHVMVVNDLPRQSRRFMSRVEGLVAWEVEVIDCSASGHGPGDSRLTSGGAFHGGIGRGTIRVYCDDAGRLVGHTFTMSVTAPFRPVTQRPIAVGRVMMNRH